MTSLDIAKGWVVHYSARAAKKAKNPIAIQRKLKDILACMYIFEFFFVVLLVRFKCSEMFQNVIKVKYFFVCFVEFCEVFSTDMLLYLAVYVSALPYNAILSGPSKKTGKNEKYYFYSNGAG